MSEKFGCEAIGEIEVERAIAEVRAGRPILLRDESRQVFVLGVESLEAGNVEHIEAIARGAAHLALAPARLKRLGAERQGAGFVALPSIDLARIATLACDPQARLDAPVMVAPFLYESALQLLRLAHVLPAALLIPAPDAAARGLLATTASHVDAFRRARERRLRIVSRAPVPLEGAPNSEFVLFRGGEGLRDQVAIIVGQPKLEEPVIVRLHSACLTGDLFGSLKCDCGDQLRHAVRYMTEYGGGILLYLDQEGRGNGLSNKIRAYQLQSCGFDTFDADEILGFDEDGRTFAFAGEMLKQLGVSKVRLMTNNPKKIGALAAAGLVVASDHRIIGRRNTHNMRYLAAKRDRAGHLLD
ncbi:GTP cyclohydrolase II RibA [Methylocystis sp. S23]|jgi:GTP cyclohydrolase II